ncbi:MAG: AbrB/MazE/SpoVT family DNA-binding domain-containing protein [Armatimonadetes bacterium]|nr:AbrB/MazE/SpoVT family DNA-binding domain-containing protein [Armatimonadota bacterium]
MITVYVSDKGQVTLPAQMRKKLGIRPKAKVEVELRENEIVLKPVRSIKDIKGALRGFVIGDAENWERIRAETEETIAREVVSEDGG